MRQANITLKIKNKIFALNLALVGVILFSQFSWARQAALVEAAETGNLGLVESLVTNNADVNAHGVWGRTALHFATDSGNAKMTEFLLKHKADVNARDENGFTPIVQARGVDVVKLLLAYGADINAHGGDNTLFSQTIENPQTVGGGMLPFLLTNGVDVTVSGTEGLFQLVLYSDDTNTMKLLVPYYVSSTNPAGRMLLQQALEVAMHFDRPQMVAAILSASDKKDFLGWTSLHIATFLGQITVAKTLLSNKANPDVRDNIGNTPLLWAAYLGNTNLVELLLHHKAKMDIKSNTELNTLGAGEDTPLDFAIQRGFTSIATMLITNGANLGPHKHYEDTPLHLATSKENVGLMKLLLAHGANINAVRGANCKQSPLDIAVCGNSPEAVRLLIADGASLRTRMQTHDGGSTTLFHLWAESGCNTNIANQLLAAGCNLNATNGDGQTPLHLAVGKWNFDYKPDPTRTNANPKWPSDFTIEYSGGEAAIWLLNHGANVNAKDKNGQTPLHLIVTRGNLKAIQALLDHGADVNATDNNGKTPLTIFEDMKKSEYNWGHGWLMQVDVKAVENLLLKYGAKGEIFSPTNRVRAAVF